MARLLLVDDEILVTRTMKALIGERFPDVEVLCASSGAETLELLKSMSFDVIVTDVAMPGMNGIELLEKVKRMWPACHVIVLTAYANFEYIYRSTKYDHVRFMLKIEPNQKIMDLIGETLEEARQEEKRQFSSTRMTEYLQRMQPTLRQNLLDHYFIYGEKLAERELREQCGIALREDRNTLPVLAVSRGNPLELQKICCLAETAFENWNLQVTTYPIDGNFFFLIQTDPENEREMPPMIREQLDRILDAQKNESGISFLIAPAFVPWDRLRNAFRQLVRLSMRVEEPDQVETVRLDGPFPFGLSPADASNWYRLMARDGLRQLADILEEDLRQNDRSTEYIRTAGAILRVLITDRYGSVHIPEGLLTGNGFSSAGEWLGQLRAFFGELEKQNERDRFSEKEQLVNRVNRFIVDHLDSDLSLSEIAGTFSYNSSYLSRAYKAATGEGINEHIMNMRIQEACRLLRGTQESLNRIAELCGFQTSKYFSAAFKKVTGVTPSQWRESEMSKM